MTVAETPIMRRDRSSSLPFIITPVGEHVTSHPIVIRVNKKQTLLPAQPNKRHSTHQMKQRRHGVVINNYFPIPDIPEKKRLSKSLDHLPSILKKPYLKPSLSNPPKRSGIFNKYTILADIPTARGRKSESDLINSEDEGIEESRYDTNSIEPIPETFRLPPLPIGSLTYQTALRAFSTDFDSSDSGNSSGEENVVDGQNLKVIRSKKKTSKVEWTGPIVSYKGHHIHLSTLNSLQVTIGRYGGRKWCW